MYTRCYRAMAVAIIIDRFSPNFVQTLLSAIAWTSILAKRVHLHLFGAGGGGGVTQDLNFGAPMSSF